MALILHLFWGSFLYAFHLYLIPFLVTPFLVMAVQPYLDLTPIKKLVDDASGKHLCRVTNGTKYSRMDQVEFVEDSL